MFCTQCGTRNEPGTRFCMNCGHPFDDAGQGAPASNAQTVAQPAPVTQQTTVTQPAPVAQPEIAVQPQPQPAPVVQQTPVTPAPASSAPAPGAAAAPAPAAPEPPQPVAPTAPAAQPDKPAKPAKEHRGHGKLIAIILVIVLVLAGGGLGAFLTWRQGLWGGVVLPQASDVKVEPGKSLTADIVVDQLKAKGVSAQKTAVFSGQPKGAFIGYEGMKPGDRVSKGQSVNVQESAGPGVPKGTVGGKATDVKAVMDGMGVPVHYKQIAVNDTAKTPEGTVVVTSPADGQALSDTQKDKGIYVGVAVKGGSGTIGWDVIGQDRDTVKSDLESQGYTVTEAPRLATSANLGKVVGADPAPGSDTSGTSVTLYYGVDAKGVQDAFSYDSPETGSRMLVGDSDLASGTWCTNAGDCITLDGEGQDYPGMGYMGSIPYPKGRDGSVYDEYNDLTACAPSMSDPYCENDAYLLKQNVGAFELLPQASVYNLSCDGKLTSSSSCSGKAEYRMQDLFLVVPVGTDLNALESKGYFDQTALDQAKGQKAPDTSRPFLLYRDPKLYDTTTAPYTDSSSANPFVPANTVTGKANDMVGMKPAPSDDTAYYLTDTARIDWGKLADAKLDGAAGNASASASASPSSSKAKTFAEVTSAIKSGDFTDIAGKYCMKDNSVCIEIDKSGKATKSGSQSLDLSPDNPTSVQLHATDAGKTGDQWFAPDPDAGIELGGPLTDYRCGGQQGFDACYNGGTFYSEAQITKPFHMAYVPAGAPVEKVGAIGGASYESAKASGKTLPDSSKPFLKIYYSKMNAAPLDENVLYKVQ